MNTRTKALSALAAAGILAAGWQLGTASGQTLNAAGSTANGVGSGATTTATPTASAKTGTFTGTRATHAYGSVQVTATLDNGTITSLTENVVSDGDRKSNQINRRAIPTLRSSLIGTDGSGASTISGATYTTGAYLTSLQSALDQAG